MSDRRRDGAWVLAAAASRGLTLDPERAEQVAAEVAPTLERFDELAAELSVDDDIFDFRRRLVAEVHD